MRRRSFFCLTLALFTTGLAAAQGDPARAFNPATAAIRKPGTVLRVDLVGDSTQTNHAGYGRGFCANLSAQIDCVNRSRGGASSKTYRAQGLWDQALATRPDYMVIQFGHNDLETAERKERQTTMAEYEANLRGFVQEARAHGIKPVLCTPLTRRYFEADGKIHSDLLGHAATMRRVATSMKVPLIDLQSDSIAYLNKYGEAVGNRLGLTKKDKDGATIPDKTHLDWWGSYLFGRMVAEDLGKVVPEMKFYVLPQAAVVLPEGMKAHAILHGGAVKIVLVGDSTVAIGGGWGQAFCALMTPNVTCLDVAQNGRSSKSFIDEGAWAKALALHGDFYLIQFGHNDQKLDPARHTDADGSFQTYLKRYVADVRAIGAIPVLVTSLSRRTMKDGKIVEDLSDYAAATKKVGADEYVTVIDLNAMSTALLNHMTQEQADSFDAVGHGDDKAENAANKPDRTHLNPHGGEVFGRMVADQLVKTEVELGPDVKGEAEGHSLVPAFAPNLP